MDELTRLMVFCRRARRLNEREGGVLCYDLPADERFVEPEREGRSAAAFWRRARFLSSASSSLRLVRWPGICGESARRRAPVGVGRRGCLGREAERLPGMRSPVERSRDIAGFTVIRLFESEGGK
jgi:hypothetical protein